MDCPYRGIHAYRFVDRPLFVGRDAEVRKISRLITLYRGVLLFGPSGAGKSSLLEAGLFPQLVEEGFEPNRMRVQPVPGEELVLERIGVASPGAPPYLPSSFLLSDPNRPRVTMSARDLRDQAVGWKMTSGEDAWSAGTPPRIPLIVVDQFEELVTLFAAESAHAARDAVVEALANLIEDEAIPVKLLFAFRDDYLARLDFFFRRSPYLRDRYVQLGPIDSSALRRVIAGAVHESPQADGGAGTPLSAAVVDAVSRAAVAYGQEGGPSLSDVQVACAELWRRDWRLLVLEDEGFDGLIEGHLHYAVDGFSHAERDTAIVLLRALVTPSGSRAVMPREFLIEVARKEVGGRRGGRAHIEEVLRKLESDAGLIRREARGEIVYYDIVSEYLVPWIEREQRERVRRKDRARIVRRSAAFLLIALLLAGAVLVGVIRSRTVAAIAEGRVQNAEERVRAAEAGTVAANTDRDRARRELEAAREDVVRAGKTRDEANGQLRLRMAELTKCRQSLDALPPPTPPVVPQRAEQGEHLETCRGRLREVEAQLARLQEDGSPPVAIDGPPSLRDGPTRLLVRFLMEDLRRCREDLADRSSKSSDALQACSGELSRCLQERAALEGDPRTNDQRR